MYPFRKPFVLLLLIGSTVLSLASPGLSQSSGGTPYWSPLDLFGGRVDALAADPSSPSTLYAATYGAGVYKSIDGGEHWTPINRGLKDRETNAIAIDPFEPSRLYVATFDQGVFTSFDAGRSWSPSNEGLPRRRLFTDQLVIDPFEPRRIYGYFGFVHGLYRSVDQGRSWISTGRELLPVTDIRNLAIDPTLSSRLYLASGRPRGYISEDFGETWTKLPIQLPDGASLNHVAVDASAVLYATTWDRGVFKSTDRGASWSKLDLPNGTDFLELAPADPEVFYAVSDQVFRSEDRGAHWTVKGSPGGEVVEDLLIDPLDVDQVYAGVQLSAVQRSSDGGVTWEEKSHGIVGSYVHALAVDPTTPPTLYVSELNHLLLAGRGRGLRKSIDGGKTWTSSASGLPGIPDTLAVDPLEPANAYAGLFEEGFYKSTDAGASWRRLDTLPLTGGDIVVDPGRPGVVYAIRGDIYRSTDGGATWSLADLPTMFELVADRRSGITYAAGNGVFASLDGGASWTERTAAPPSGFFLDLAVDAFDPRILYGTDGDVVYKSADGGVSWFRLFTANPPTGPLTDGVRQLLADPSRPSTVYARGHFGVIRSTDAGATWARLIGGLDGRAPLHLAAVASEPGVLYAATGAGLFRLGAFPRREVLELQGGRFEVEVSWRDFAGQEGVGKVASIAAAPKPPPADHEQVPDFLRDQPVAVRSRDSAVVEFFSADNWEMLIKVLDGRSLNDHHWVFLAGATNVAFTATVTDTACGSVRSYRNRLGETAQAVTDTLAFSECAAPSAPSCVAADGTLCLGEDGRFKVEIAWTDFSGQAGMGRQVRVAEAGAAESDDSGLFYFFNPENWELLVKVLDGCEVNGHYWVLGAATTNVEVMVRVTDRDTGQVETYHNPLGKPAEAILDTNAFATCSQP